jgi:peptidoglycan-N-acetylglucosamine deacetylase
MHRTSALKVAQSGNEIGNHSYSHGRLRWRSFSTLDHEVVKTDSLVRSLGYEGPLFFRAPFGDSSGLIGWWLLLRGRQNIGYTLSPNPPDYLRRNPREIANQLIRRSEPGSILLLHDGEGLRVESLEALNEIIPALQAKGFTFVRLSELLSRSNKADLP